MGVNCHFVFDANAANSFNVDARFQGNDVPCPDPLRLTPTDARSLVYLYSNPVASPVDKVATEMVGVQDAPGGTIHLSGGDIYLKRC